jgi:ATP-dependent Lon protease
MESTPLTDEAEERHQYPLIPLKDTVIFPRATATLNIGRDKSIQAIYEPNSGYKRFIASAQKQSDLEHPGPDDVFDVGTLVELKQLEAQNNSVLQVVVEGITRVKILEWVEQGPYLQVVVEEQNDSQLRSAQSAALMRHAQSLFDRYTHLSRRFNAEDITAISHITEPGALADALAPLAAGEYVQQQELLETFDQLARLEKLCVTLGNEIEILELENKIRQKVRQQVDKNQREYYLKEQLRAIQEELGHDQASEVAELRQKVLERQMPAEVMAKVNKELDRLERMPSHSAELVVLRNYIDWVLALPWSERTEDRLDMPHAQKVLDNDHYGLEKVKERII